MQEAKEVIKQVFETVNPLEGAEQEAPIVHEPMTEGEYKKRMEKLEKDTVKDAEPLTPLHWSVYRAIRDNTLSGNPPLTQRQVVDIVNADMEKMGHSERLPYVENDANHCRMLWDLVQDINDSEQTEKVIVIFRYTYLLGNEWETKWYRNKLRHDGIRKLVRAARVKRKTGRNGQGKFIDCHGKVLEVDIDFVEAYPVIEQKKTETTNQ